MPNQPSRQDDVAVRLSPQDYDHILAALEWALGHDCGGGPNESTLDEFIAPGLRRWAIEEAARKVEAVADLHRQGVDTDFSIIGSVPQPTLLQRARELFAWRWPR